jgi:hypothetical protein
MVRYLWPFLYEISSIPILVRFSKRSWQSSTSRQVRSMITPTVRQAVLISEVTALLDIFLADQAARASKPTVCPAPAQGTSASRKTCSTAASRCRHRRGPAPRP